MEHLSNLNWFSILACLVAGQIFLTIWFVAIFAKPWARCYGVDEPKEHTKQVPGYTYGIGALCVVLLAIGLATLQAAFGVATLGGALGLGLFLGVTFAAATAVPGYAFLRRWDACVLAVGSQVALVLVLSTILALWPKG